MQSCRYGQFHGAQEQAMTCIPRGVGDVHSWGCVLVFTYDGMACRGEMSPDLVRSACFNDDIQQGGGAVDRQCSVGEWRPPGNGFLTIEWLSVASGTQCACYQSDVAFFDGAFSKRLAQ